eukprot:7694691-Alexandrium_andersonii.AAC.1
MCIRDRVWNPGYYVGADAQGVSPMEVDVLAKGKKGKKGDGKGKNGGKDQDGKGKTPDVTCYICGRKGHYSCDCWFKDDGKKGGKNNNKGKNNKAMNQIGNTQQQTQQSSQGN